MRAALRRKILIFLDYDKSLFVREGLVFCIVALSVIFAGYYYFVVKGWEDGRWFLSAVRLERNFHGAGDRDILLNNFPGPNASEYDKDIFQKILHRNAVSGDHVDITGCNSSPLVFVVLWNHYIRFKNNGSPDLFISIGKRGIRVPAKSTAGTKADFDQGPGVYGYGCSDKSGESGPPPSPDSRGGLIPKDTIRGILMVIQG